MPLADDEDESLDSNLLQLPSPSLLLLNELSLTPGTLKEQGISNLRSLSKLVSQGVLEYEFPYSQPLEFAVEHAVLILSNGSKALLSQDGQHAIDITLKLKPEKDDGVEGLYRTQEAALALPQPTEEQLNFWRAYLLLTRVSEFAIAAEHSSLIETAYLALRSARPTETNELTLHLLLNLARLHCLSHGENQLSEQRWKEVNALFESVYQRGKQA